MVPTTHLTRIAVLLAATIFALSLVGCSPERDVSYVNETNAHVTVLSDGSEVTTLQPGESKTFRIRKSQMPEHVEALDKDGDALFDEVLTWEDLEERDFQIVISEDR